MDVNDIAKRAIARPEVYVPVLTGEIERLRAENEAYHLMFSDLIVEIADLRAERDALSRAGTRLSNIAFNLKQHSGEPITEETAKLMADAQKRWDATLRGDDNR